MTNVPEAGSSEGWTGEAPADHPDGTRAQIEFDADRETVFAHLVDPTTYPHWLVGAQKVLSVDEAWPAPGSAFHHRVGFGPATIQDRTVIVTCRAPDELLLRAEIGPFGSALIRFRLEGSAPTTVLFDEAPDSGFIKRLGSTVGRWALKPTAWGRNQRSLQRLDELLQSRDTHRGATMADETNDDPAHEPSATSPEPDGGPAPRDEEHRTGARQAAENRAEEPPA